MAKVVVLSSEEIQVGEDKTPLTLIQLLKKVGKKYVVQSYYLTKDNNKGFKQDMVAPDLLDDENSDFVLDAEFEEAIDFKTGQPKLVLASLAR